MSIKGSNNKLNVMKALPVCVIGTVIAIILRVIQVFTIIEPETGFYSEVNATVYALYGVLAVASVIIFAITYLARKVPESRLPLEKNIPLAIFSLLSGAVMAFDVVICISGFLDKYKVYNSAFNAEQTLSSYLMKSGATPMLLESIFALFAVVYFLILAINYFGVNVEVTKFRILVLAPVLWATARMVQRFTKTISFIQVSDLLLELFMIAFLMLFLMNYAQVSANINSKAAMNKVYAFGLMYAMFAFVIYIPRFITSLEIANTVSVIDYGFSPVDLILSVFVVLMLVAMNKIPKTLNITVKQAEKEAESKEKDTEEE